MFFNVNLFYQKCLKLVDQAYQRLNHIQHLPQQKVICRHRRFYDTHGHLLLKRDLKVFHRQLNQKMRLTKLNKELINMLQKYIRVLQIFDQSLSTLLKMEVTAYYLDEIPIKARKHLLKDLMKKIRDLYGLKSLNDWQRWARGEIQARELTTDFTQKIAN